MFTKYIYRVNIQSFLNSTLTKLLTVLMRVKITGSLHQMRRVSISSCPAGNTGRFSETRFSMLDIAMSHNQPDSQFIPYSCYSTYNWAFKLVRLSTKRYLYIIGFQNSLVLVSLVMLWKGCGFFLEDPRKWQWRHLKRDLPRKTKSSSYRRQPLMDSFGTPMLSNSWEWSLSENQWVPVYVTYI